jgi:hypothetical protein
MANDQQLTNNYTLPTDSYVSFDAIALRNLIIERLNKQGLFTDQNYIGSNLASIIDIVSFAYNTLIFYLNKTSSESMFTEAQLYENINRIVKLLDYKPVGYQTSTLVFNASATTKFSTDTSFNSLVDLAVGQSYTIPRYSYLMIGGIPFSFNEDITFSTNQSGIIPLEDLSSKYLLYQGIFKEMSPYAAQGNSGEIINISNSIADIDHFNIDVYVYEIANGFWSQYKNVPSLYTERSFDRVFEKRITSNKTYEIVLGDGINGRKLESGDLVSIFYLESNGAKGVVGPNTLNSSTPIVYSSLTFGAILSSLNVENFEYLNSKQFLKLKFENVVGSTLTKEMETVESIRNNAPSNFKSQYRLVTKQDYESFIKTNFANFVSDAKVFSNWDYTAKYLKYFNNISVKPTQFRQILLNNVLYADSCNFNNIYVCAIPKISPGSSLKYLLPAQKEAILSNIIAYKTLTTEVVFMDPIYKAISFAAKSNNLPRVVEKDFSKLRIIKTSQTARSNRSITNDVKTAFENFFDPTKTQLGKTFDYSGLVSQLLSIEGVLKIETKNMSTGDIYEGLSLIMWNPVYEDLDVNVIVNDTEMEEFSFLYFYDLFNIHSKIEIVESTFLQ